MVPRCCCSREAAPSSPGRAPLPLPGLPMEVHGRRPGLLLENQDPLQHRGGQGVSHAPRRARCRAACALSKANTKQHGQVWPFIRMGTASAHVGTLCVEGLSCIVIFGVTWRMVLSSGNKTGHCSGYIPPFPCTRS